MNLLASSVGGILLLNDLVVAMRSLRQTSNGSTLEVCSSKYSLSHNMSIEAIYRQLLFFVM